MSVSTTRYVRKPLYVDAVRITRSNFEKVTQWCHGEIQETDVGKKFIFIDAHNPINPRQTKGFIGDWVLRTNRGYKIYTNKAFSESFDEIKPDKQLDVVTGSEEIMVGITLNEVVAMVQDGRLPIPPLPAVVGNGVHEAEQAV